MNSLRRAFLEHQPLSLGLIQTVRRLGEYQGKHELFAQQSPQILDSLQESARVESVEVSNRIEGLLPRRIGYGRLLLKGSPPNGSEKEIAGYRDVLATIHTSYEHIPITPNLTATYGRAVHFPGANH